MKFRRRKADSTYMESDDRLEMQIMNTHGDPYLNEDRDIDQDLVDAKTLVDARMLGGPEDGLQVQIPRLSVRMGLVGILVDDSPAIARVIVGEKGTPQVVWSSIRTTGPIEADPE